MIARQLVNILVEGATVPRTAGEKQNAGGPTFLLGEINRPSLLPNCKLSGQTGGAPQSGYSVQGQGKHRARRSLVSQRGRRTNL
jgi:hypothetical protein